MDWVDKPQNYKGLYGLLQLLQGCHLNNVPLKTLKLWLDNLSFSRISVKMFRFSIQSIQETRPSPLTFLQWAIYIVGNWSRYNLCDIVTKASVAFVASTDPDVHFKCYIIKR